MADEVIARLLHQISTGQYKVGERLPAQPELMEGYGVGRSTIREAIRIWANLGVGTVASPFTATASGLLLAKGGTELIVGGVMMNNTVNNMKADAKMIVVVQAAVLQETNLKKAENQIRAKYRQEIQMVILLNIVRTMKTATSRPSSGTRTRRAGAIAWMILLILINRAQTNWITWQML